MWSGRVRVMSGMEVVKRVTRWIDGDEMGVLFAMSGIEAFTTCSLDQLRVSGRCRRFCCWACESTLGCSSLHEGDQVMWVMREIHSIGYTKLELTMSERAASIWSTAPSTTTTHHQ